MYAGNIAKPQGLMVATIPAVKAKAKFTSLIAEQLIYPANESRIVEHPAVALEKPAIL